ncbi:reverse transcriptase domain-containing protein [Tanacetum coccineum]
MKRPHSRVFMERSPIVACLSAYAMHRARSKGKLLSRLDKMLRRCEDTNLCLNWEKSHFMVKEGIVLGHKISKNRIEVDKEKVDVIAKLPHPTTVKGVRSFLGHAAFETLKTKLTEAPILIAPDWDLPFELMCDASDFAIGAVLGQRHEKHFRLIHYASKTMTEAEWHYTTTEKEMLAVEYAFEKFQSYLILNKIHVGIADHSASRNLFAKKRFQGEIALWVLLLQEFKFKMPMTWSPDVTLVQRQRKFRNVMKCLKIPSMFAKSLTCRASISWGRSRLHEGARFELPAAIIIDRGLSRIFEASRARGFVLRSQRASKSPLHWEIQYPILIRHRISIWHT